MSNITHRRLALWRWFALVAAVLSPWVLTLAVPTAVVYGAKGGSCAAFSVTVGGRTYRGDQKITIPAQRVTGPIQVRGTFVEFNVAPSTFSVSNYTLTGARSSRPDKDLPLNGRTVVFTSKVPQHGDTLNSALSLELSNEGVVLRRSGAFQKMKIQAKDCPQGGLFQMEPEPATREVNTLGPSFRYTVTPPGTGRLCFTNGAFSGYDSPEFATLVSNTQTRAVWRVAAGGRVGMVIGEDAVEGGCRP